MRLKLKDKEVRKALIDLDRSLTWLADRLKISRSLLDYDLKCRNTKRAAEIAGVLGVDPFSLIDIEGKGIADGESKDKKLAEVADLP